MTTASTLLHQSTEPRGNIVARSSWIRMRLLLMFAHRRVRLTWNIALLRKHLNLQMAATTSQSSARLITLFLVAVCIFLPLSHLHRHGLNRYYSHPLNLGIIIEHVHELFPLIVSTRPIADLAEPDRRRLPQYASFSDPSVTKKVIRETTTTNLHPCETCAILPKDQGGVVKPEIESFRS